MSSAKARPGLSVVKLLVGAAVAGAVGGVVLASRRAPRDEDAMLQGSEEVAAKAMPLGASRPFDPMKPDPKSLQGIPPYPGAAPRKLTGSPAGAEVSASSWFSTQDSVDKVLTFYEEAYLKANIRYAAHRFSPKRGYVSWFEPRRPADGGSAAFGDGVLHLVFASREGSSTMVLLGANEPYQMLQRVHALPAGVRLPAGPKPQVMTLGEVGAESYSIYALYPPQPIQELLSELKRELAEGGWKAGEPSTTPSGKVNLVASNARFTQAITLESAARGIQVLITVEQQQAGRVQ